jgi:biopolymer transport protein ExbB/TolQ
MSFLLWLLCGLVLAVVVWLSWAAREETRALAQLSKEFYAYLVADDREASRESLIDQRYQDVKAAYARKAARGDSSDALLSLLEADALGHRSRISTRVELMPQIGLLGTVVGVIGTLLGSGVQLEGLWTALITTALGLSFALATRWRYELPAEEKVLAIMRVLEGERSKRSRSVEGAPPAGMGA